MSSSASTCKIFKFVSDNVDTHKGVRDIRTDNRGSLIHMYSIHSVFTRVPLLYLSNAGTTGNLQRMQAHEFFPDESDVLQVKHNLCVLASNILCANIKCLQPLAKIAPQSIPHKYDSVMSQKSETYFLDVLLKNEAKHGDMIDIMLALQDYMGHNSYRCLSGGDQLTCERQCCAQRHMMDSDTEKDKLQLLVPVCEDWHVLMCFLKVCRVAVRACVFINLAHCLQIIWKKLVKSCKSHGTLGYFCSMLGRMPDANNPKKNMNACTDVLFTVLKGHYVALACKLLNIQDPTADCPTVDTLEGKEAKLAFLAKLSLDVISRFSIIKDAVLGCKIYGTKDDAYDYARVFCHFASLALEFKNGWEEGDGDRVIRCWKFFLLHFRAYSTRSKYAWEALRLQFQLVHLPPFLSQQLRWERFVNVHGGKGNNIPCDLYNEHMNKAFKEIVSHMGANLTEKTAQTAARSVTTLQMGWDPH